MRTSYLYEMHSLSPSAQTIGRFKHFLWGELQGIPNYNPMAFELRERGSESCIPYSREQKHVSVSDISRLEAPASWPSLPV